MDNLKYIINEDHEFLIFSLTVTHADIAANFGKIIGAGFCTLNIKKGAYGDEQVDISCYGESWSLGIKSREEDKEIIQRQL